MTIGQSLNISRVLVGMNNVNVWKAEIKQLTCLLLPYLAQTAEQLGKEDRLVSYPYHYPWNNVDAFVRVWAGKNALVFKAGVAQEDSAVRFMLAYITDQWQEYEAGSFTLVEKAIGSVIGPNTSVTSEGLTAEDTLPCRDLLESFIWEFLQNKNVPFAVRGRLSEKISFFDSMVDQVS